MSPPDDSQRSIPSLWPYLIACVFAGILIDFGTLHRHHQADSLLPVLVSLQRWTPFFWCQDRIGMLVPLLAAPLRHPLANLFFQETVYVGCGLAAVFLLFRYALRDATYPVAAAVSAALFLILAPASYRFVFFSGTFYGVWLALGLGGLLLMEPAADGGLSPPRGLAGLGLLFLAHWVFSAAVLCLGPLVIFRALFFRADTEVARGGVRPGAAPREIGTRDPMVSSVRFWLRKLRPARPQLIGLAFAFGGGLVLAGLSPDHQLDPRGSSPTQWPEAWRRLALTTWDALVPHYWPMALGGAAASGLVLLCFPSLRRTSAPAVRAATTLAAAGLFFGLFMGTRQWVTTYDYDARYLMPAVFLLQAAAVAIGVAPACAALGVTRLRRIELLAVPSLLLAAVVGYGVPSLEGVRADLDRLGGARAREVVAARCTHVAGDYWTVWPLVFCANMIHYETGDSRVTWGISFRYRPTQPLGVHVPTNEIRVAVALGEQAEAAYWLEGYGLPPLAVAEEWPTIQVLVPIPARGSPKPAGPD